MKGNKKYLVLVLLLLLIAVSFGTYAIYKSSATGSASATAFGNYNAAESSCVAHTIAKSDTTTTLSNIEKACD